MDTDYQPPGYVVVGKSRRATRQSESSEDKLFRAVQNAYMRHNRLNSKQPSSLQTITLKKMLRETGLGRNYFRRLSPSAWFKCMHKLIDIINADNDDMKWRASECASAIIESGKNAVAYMDGHGRFTYWLMHYLDLNGIDLDAFEFHIVDNDIQVNQWHHLFMPDKFNIINDDIMHYAIGAYKALYPYLNFCGITEALAVLTSDFMPFAHNNQLDFMISFSAYRSAKGYSDLFDKHQKAIRITARDNYLTYRIIW